MNKNDFLSYHCNATDLQAKRLHDALHEVKMFLPLTSSKLENLPVQSLALIDMMTFRFAKVQDVLGSKVFPAVLELLQEDAVTFIDKLNRLEKLGYLTSTAWWTELRELRNQIAHDYTDSFDLVAKRANEFAAASEELLAFWAMFKAKIQNLYTP